MIVNKIEALTSLRPNNGLGIVNGEFLWYAADGSLDENVSQPTEAEIHAEMQRLQTEYDNNQYQRDRQYPPIGDQLDMIYHAGLGGDEFQAAIKAVKDAHPKPE